MVIFHSYVKLPEGRFQYALGFFWTNFCLPRFFVNRGPGPDPRLPRFRWATKRFIAFWCHREAKKWRNLSLLMAFSKSPMFTCSHVTFQRNVTWLHTLWLCQNSYWKWPFIVSFPIKHGGSFHSYVNVYQRVHLHMATWKIFYPSMIDSTGSLFTQRRPFLDDHRDSSVGVSAFLSFLTSLKWAWSCLVGGFNMLKKKPSWKMMEWKSMGRMISHIWNEKWHMF